MLGFSLNSKLDWISYIVCIATSASKKIGAFFNSEIPWNKIYHLILHTVVMPRLVLLITATFDV